MSIGMSSIPNLIKPWATELSLISPSCWPLLGTLLPRLGNVLFRPADTADDRQQPPDGFDGVSNKGTLDRLLPTEWGLLDAYSDEFYRRLAMGESQYLKPGYQQQQRSHDFYVLLDRGPDQFGAPLLIQFALLLVLARRAREAKQKLHVGFIQTPGEWIVATPDSLQKEIHPYTSHARIVPDMITDWQQAIGPKESQDTGSQVTEIDLRSLWIAASPIQSTAITQRPNKGDPFGQLLIIDSDTTVSDHQPLPTLSVLFHPRQQRLHFHIPNDNQALRLLRNPFKTQSSLVAAPRELNRFQLHPTARVCFFYADDVLLTTRLPKQTYANRKRLKSYKQTIKHSLVGVWHSKNQTGIVQVDEEALYCTGFFQQGKITVPLKTLSNSFVNPQVNGAVPLAHTIKRNRKAVVIIKDGNSQGFALHFEKTDNFVFKVAIALGPMHHEYLVEQSFFYTDGQKTLYEINLEDSFKRPREYSCEHYVFGLIQQYGKVDSRYTSVLPLMKNNNEDWVDTLRQEYTLDISDKPIGGNNTFMLVKRGDYEIRQLYRDRGNNAPTAYAPTATDTCLIQEDEPIVHAAHQSRNQWIVYQTASRLKTYSLKDKAKIINMELSDYAK